MPEPWFPDRAASRAVLIGSSTFHSADLPDLPAVAHNLDALHQVFTDPGHGVIGGCAVLADQDVSDAKVGVALSEAAGEATDLLLVYYAGHGVLDDDGRLHLAHPGTSMDHVSWTSLSVDLIKRDLGRARARARVLVLDCCFSGRAVAAMADSRSLVAGQLDLSGTYTLASTTATAPSHAPPDKRYTSFTDALLGSLAQPDPLTLDGIYSRIDAELDGLGLPRPQHNATNNVASLGLTRGPVLPSAKHPATREPGTAMRPVAERVFDVSRPPSPGRRVKIEIGWGIGIIGSASSLIALLVSGTTHATASVIAGSFLFLSLLLMVGIVDATLEKGTLELTDQYLTADLPSGRRTRIAWNTIRMIHVFDINRPRNRSPHCGIEIDLAPPNDGPPNAPFLPVANETRSTYRFGYIKTDADTLVAALRRTAGDKLADIGEPTG